MSDKETDSTLEFLSAEEIAAMAEDDDTEVGDVENAGEEEGEGDGGQAAQGDAEAQPKSAEAVKPDADDDTGKPAAANSGEPGDEGELEDKGRHDDNLIRMNATLPDDFGAKLEHIKEQKKELATQLMEGDIDIAEFTVKNAELDDQKDELSELRVKAEVAKEINAAQATNREQAWQNAQNEFFADSNNKIYSKEAENGNIMFAALAQAIGQLSEDENGRNYSNERLLAEADKMVRKAFNIGAAPVVPPTTQPKPQTNKVADIPKTLGGLPAAEASETGTGGEFDYLDKLDGLDLERAIARLTPEQEERYLRAG